jgi:hypothetical protein
MGRKLFINPVLYRLMLGTKFEILGVVMGTTVIDSFEKDIVDQC